MNTPDPDPALTSWAQKIPRPVLRDDARRRSLDAALAAADSEPGDTRKRPRLSPHWIACAACWAITGILWWTSPPRPSPAASPPAGFAGWQGPHAATPQDEDTARLLATFYSPHVEPTRSPIRKP